jgi:hypothetical protein
MGCHLQTGFRLRKKNVCIILIIILFNVLLHISYAEAATYLDLDDEAYYVLDRLEAEGVIKSALLSTKPLSRKEIVRLIQEAEINSKDKSEEIKSQVEFLEYRFKDDIEGTNFIKLDTVYANYSFHDSDLRILNYNNDGDTPGKGSNVRAGAITRVESKWFSAYANPEFGYSKDFTALKARKLYGLISLFGLDLVAGKDSQWWGPGYHGSLLLSNNPEPLKIIKLTNPEPVILPWIFKYLGPFRFTAFVTRLEKDRMDVSEPILWGLNLDFKPIPYLELGLQRTAIFGGEGRPESLKVWWNSLTGSGENVDSPTSNEAGDQLAGFYGKLTLPFKWQPIQLYLDAVGEDQRNSFPSKWGYISGIYLPRFAGLERFDLRGEFAINHIGGWPNYWYNHHIYTQGYTYKGKIIGHHMGTDSRDIFVEASYLIPDSYSRISLAYDREEHNLSGTVREKKDEFDLKGVINLTKDLELTALYGFGRVTNLGNVSSDEKTINIITGELRYRF